MEGALYKIAQRFYNLYYSGQIVSYVIGAWGSVFSFTTITPEVVERPFDRLTVLPSAMSSLRSELRVEDGPNGAREGECEEKTVPSHQSHFKKAFAT